MHPIPRTPPCTFTVAILKTGVMCPRLLRVYGEEIEREAYPLPWVPKYPRRFKQARAVLDEAASVSLPVTDGSQQVLLSYRQVDHMQQTLLNSDE